MLLRGLFFSKKISWALMALLSIGSVILSWSKFSSLQKLNKKLLSYEQKNSSLEAQKKDLEAEISASNDPKWVELLLMEELGVIPDGAIKIEYHEDI